MTRRFQIKQLLATYRGMGLSDEEIGRAVIGFVGDREVTIDEIETALREEVLNGGLDLYESDETSGALAVAGGLKRNEASARYALAS